MNYSLGINGFCSDVDMCTNASGVKKPAGTAEEIEKHFGCEASRLIMVHKNSAVLSSISYFFVVFDSDLC